MALGASPGWVDAVHVVVGGIGFLLPVPWNLAALGAVTVSAFVRAALTVLSINGQRRWASDCQRALARLFSRK